MKAEGAAKSAAYALADGRAKDAAWWGLYALELDEQNGLAWALLGRIVAELNRDSLGALGLTYGLELGVPNEFAAGLRKFRRIDLWTRGLIRHESRAAVLSASTFHDEHAFVETDRYPSWIEEQQAPWGGEAGAAGALRRMISVLSDATTPPADMDNPLASDAGWNAREEFVAWKADRTTPESPVEWDEDEELTLLSDYWAGQEIMELGASGQLEIAKARTEAWIEARPSSVAARAALIRVLSATDETEARDAAIEDMLSLDADDLNELEEARVTLGMLELWGPQVRVLDRMTTIAPGHPVILANRGLAFLELGEQERAQTDLVGALATDPENALALAHLGLLRLRQEEFTEARGLLERAVEAAPEQVEPRIYLAVCKSNQGSREAAIKELERVLEMSPGHPDAERMLTELESP